MNASLHQNPREDTMTDIRFRCCACQKKLTVVGSAAGKKVTCPWCSTPINIPTRSTFSPDECGPEIGQVSVVSSALPAEQLLQHMARFMQENQDLKKENEHLRVKASDSQRLLLDLRDLQNKIEQFDALTRRYEDTLNKLDSAHGRMDHYRLELYKSEERIRELEAEVKRLTSRPAPNGPTAITPGHLSPQREPSVPLVREVIGGAVLRQATVA